MSEIAPEPDPGGRPTRRGPGRLLIAVYGVFALSATGRSSVQLSTKFGQAPLAFLLSGFAAAVYIVATVSLARAGRTSRRVAYVAICTELAGVVLIGSASLIFPDSFPEATVWSGYGSGYGFVPLVLPFFGLWWLRRSGRDRRPAQAGSG
jgi:drug/metabolite transporter (DMT)-like permease